MQDSLYILFQLVKGQDQVHPRARISRIPQNRVSNGGGVITIYGRDFAADNFNQFEPDLGNRVNAHIM